MRAKKFLRCPDCRKGFSQIKNLNMHIAKTGHNDRKQIDVFDIWTPKSGLILSRVTNKEMIPDLESI